MESKGEDNIEKPDLKVFPIIASVTRMDQLEAAMSSRVDRVILMAGDILNLSEIVDSLHQSGKKVFVHLEMVGGIGRDNVAVQYIADRFGIDGIVTTKTNAVAAARQAGIMSIQRVFAIDSAAVETAVKMINQARPDEVELMPGLMPRVIADMKKRIERPLIVGELIRSEQEIHLALESGANHISTGAVQFW
ncbi:glycerol-3-phosphate responsive antiterminator [Paenibacillus lemnae]|uniref:Glycerol uptake operon antiterminator regulatory protein n=1 Tax=Paenibacillus lemnae TaxID=1330551 RepID=A0A848M9M9_PAELE|nr:glycerol-3-phosphate responsive antiterminator [Paenibacillus lemnae]NMO97385.1 glycerol-3-phosphate responsive antiterminator [Paenibacillus lemnae]